MRGLGNLLLTGLIFAGISLAQSENDFSGAWKLNLERSEIRGLPRSPDPFLKIERKGAVLHLSGAITNWTYPLDNNETKQRLGDASFSTRTKWEGSALLVNTLVSGPQSYTVMERWRKSKDGQTLTVKRTIVRMSGENESILVYENPDAPPVVAEAKPARVPPQQPQEFVIQAGTRIPLNLVNSVNTKHTAPGDRIHLQTSFPILVSDRIVIPRGSFVVGTVTESQRAGKVKGKAALYLRFDSLTLPNGVTRDFRSRVGNIDADLDRAEGKITGPGAKGRDARTVGETTAAGASVGSVATRTAAGAGIGAAAGAAAGLIGILGSRGADLILPQGTPMEMVLDRDLHYTAAELPPIER